jgi:hypothetical protein
MNRLALALSLALVGPGCIVTNDTNPPPQPPCNPSAVIDWRYQGGSSGGFVDATNSILATCAAAGVTTVEVWVNGAKNVFGCGSGPGVVALAPGANDVVVEGLDVPSSSGGIILYRDRFPIDAITCGNEGVFVAQPAEGRVTVAYTFSPVNSCYSPGPSFVWVRVWDDLAGVVAADSASAPEASDTCGVDFPLSFRLAAGSYTLLSTEEVIRGAAPGTYVPKAANCANASFTVGAGLTTPLSRVLADANAFCP